MIKPNFYTQKIEEGNYGKFIFEPLNLSFAQSLGHALRRTLLSSLKGAAVTQVKIKGVSHLFSTIDGVKESVLDIVLNLKQLKFDIRDGGPFKLSLNVKGEKKVYAKDIEGEINPINKDFYICEITNKNTELSIDLIVETGVGYITAEDKQDKEFGYIAVDAFFSPIRKVNFKVEEARVGRKANFERLILEIWTDGSIKPPEALKQASEILVAHFSRILSGEDDLRIKNEETKKEATKNEIDKKLYDIIIDELNLPSRVINALLREKIETVADLLKVGKDKLVSMKGVGKKSIELIINELKKMGIEL